MYVIVRMVFFYSSFTWKHWVGLVVTSIGYGVPYKFLDGMAKPSVSEDGELIDGGFDMSTGGICGYVLLSSKETESVCLFFVFVSVCFMCMIRFVL